MKSLLDQLSSIVAEGKREAERVMERAGSNYRLGLQTRELVIPSKDASISDFLRTSGPAAEAVHLETSNRLIYGDNLLVLAALLAGSESYASARGKLDLIYIDPPFDSKSDYRTTIVLPSASIEQKPTAIEQFAYSDTWVNGTASYLAMLTPRLFLMRDFLSDEGSLYVHVGPNVASYVEAVLNEIFGVQYNASITWKRVTAHGDSQRWGTTHDVILWRPKGENFIWNPQFEPYSPDYVSSRYNNTTARPIRLTGSRPSAIMRRMVRWDTCHASAS